MSDLRINNITNRTGRSGPVIAGLSTVTGTGSFTVPVGPTEMRGGRGRAIFNGGYEAPSNTSEIQTVEIATTGNATNFGNLSTARQGGASVASSTRGISAGGNPSQQSVIEYILFSSSGGANDFGDLTIGRRSFAGAGNNTRGVFFGGNTPTRQSIIDYITIATTGNATEFGRIGVNAGNDSTEGGFGNDDNAACSSPTRAFVFGSGNMTNVIQFVTISTRGDSQDFGDLTQGNVRFPAGLSSNTRGVSGGGRQPSPLNQVNIIQSFEMATLGNAANFGDLTRNHEQMASASSHTRGIFAGGYIPTSPYVAYNVIDYITIASAGNASDFGDLTYSGQTNGASRGFSGCSDVHGGLG
jgi:hypothetical protein